MTLRVRWLGRVPYREALAVQQALFTDGIENHLLLLEHPHVFTHGPRADLAVNVLVDPAAVGAELVSVKRGGDVTYHGPGQLVGYPIVNVSNSIGAADHVCAIQRLIVASLNELGVADVGCLDEYPGVWVGVSGPSPRKICAIGVRLARGRTMHGFALNIAPDMRYMRDYIVPCGIPDRPVTSLAEEGIDASLEDVAEIVARHAAAVWGGASMERQDVAWKHRPDDLSAFSRGEGPGAVVRRLAQVGVADRGDGGTAGQRRNQRDGIVGLVPRHDREDVGTLDDAGRLEPWDHHRRIAVAWHHQHGESFQRHRLVAGQVREVAADRDQQDVDAGVVHSGACATDAVEVCGCRRCGAHRAILAQTNDNDTVSATDTASAA